jgi:predicted HTH domain antitoxin
MDSTVFIKIPREVVHATQMSPDELRQELAIYLFQQGKLSFGKAREMAGLTAWSFQQVLAGRGIDVHYGVAEYEQDRATLKERGRL